MIRLIRDPTADTMEFSNGCRCTFPQAPGLWIGSFAPGTGKSTIIKEICCCKDYRDKGIWIVEQTVDACNELEGKLLHESGCLYFSFLNLNSENTNAMEMYRNDPHCLEKYDILITTAARMIIDPVDLFLGFKGCGKRGYVFLDELNSFFPDPFQIPERLLDITSYVDRCRTHDGVDGFAFVSNGKTYYQHFYRNRDIMIAAMERSKFRLFPGKNPLNEYKRNYILDHLLKKGNEPLLGKVKDWCGEAVTVLMDGTADCIFDSSDSRILPISGYRYSSDIEFIPFSLPFERKNPESWKESDLCDKSSESFFSMIKGITDTGEKVLVYTWKTIDKFTNNGSADSLENALINEGGKIKYDFPKILSECLVRFGIPDTSFKVIYRGSGDDRGSNDFRDFQNIVILGEWRIPDDIVGDINSMYGCKSTFRGYMKSSLIQAICRLQIRKHQGLPIKVYVSDDVDYGVLYEVQEYFIQHSPPEVTVKGINKPCKLYSKPEKQRLMEMVMLYSYDSGLRDYVEGKSKKATTYKLSIPLNDLYNIIPRKRKSKDRYNNLIKFLKDKNIQLIIG